MDEVYVRNCLINDKNENETKLKPIAMIAKRSNWK